MEPWHWHIVTEKTCVPKNLCYIYIGTARKHVGDTNLQTLITTWLGCTCTYFYYWAAHNSSKCTLVSINDRHLHDIQANDADKTLVACLRRYHNIKTAYCLFVDSVELFWLDSLNCLRFTIYTRYTRHSISRLICATRWKMGTLTLSLLTLSLLTLSLLTLSLLTLSLLTLSLLNLSLLTLSLLTLSLLTLSLPTLHC